MSFKKIIQVLEQILQYPLFTVNQTPITLSSFLMVAIAMIVVIIGSRIFIRVVLAKLLARTKLDSGMQYTFTRVTHYLILAGGSIVAFQIVGIDLSGLIVIFGFLSVGIGFGLQNITSNFISGLILLFERPIKVGDRVVVGDTEGDVLEIHMRSTLVRTQNKVSIIVPNSEFISSNVINWSHGDPQLRLDIDVGVSYNSDLDTVIRSLKEVAAECSEVLSEPAPEVLLLRFGDSSWDMQLRVWIDEAKRHWQVRSQLNCAIVHKFRENKVEIPFPQRDLHVRSGLSLPSPSNN